MKQNHVRKMIKGCIISLVLIMFFLPMAANAQPLDSIVEGSGIYLYAEDSAYIFDSGNGKNVTLDILSGVFNGSNGILTITSRGGSLYFYSHDVGYIQFTNNYADFHARINYDGITFTALSMDSWNGTVPANTECYLNWGWSFYLPHEENFMFWVGLVGVFMVFFGVMVTAYDFRHYPLFTLTDRETVLEKYSFMAAVIMVILGLGLIVSWLVS